MISQAKTTKTKVTIPMDNNTSSQLLKTWKFILPLPVLILMKKFKTNKKSQLQIKLKICFRVRHKNCKQFCKEQFKITIEVKRFLMKHKHSKEIQQMMKISDLLFSLKLKSMINYLRICMRVLMVLVWCREWLEHKTTTLFQNRA